MSVTNASILLLFRRVSLDNECPKVRSFVPLHRQFLVGVRRIKSLGLFEAVPFNDGDPFRRRTAKTEGPSVVCNKVASRLRNQHRSPFGIRLEDCGISHFRFRNHVGMRPSLTRAALEEGWPSRCSTKRIIRLRMMFSLRPPLNPGHRSKSSKRGPPRLSISQLARPVDGKRPAPLFGHSRFQTRPLVKSN